MRFPSATLTRDIRRDPPPSLHTTAAGPQLRNSSFSAPEKALKIQHHFFQQKLPNLTKWNLNATSFGCQNPPKSLKNTIPHASEKTTPTSLRKCYQHGRPGPLKPSISLKRGCNLALLQHLAKSIKLTPKSTPKYLQKPSKFGSEASSKRCQK